MIEFIVGVILGVVCAIIVIFGGFLYLRMRENINEADKLVIKLSTLYDEMNEYQLLKETMGD